MVTNDCAKSNYDRLHINKALVTTTTRTTLVQVQKTIVAKKTLNLHIYYLCICKWFDHFGNGLIRTTDPENLGVDIIFIILSHVCSQLWPKNRILVMAALICILLKMLKGARMASSGFLISMIQRYKNCKKTL